jgi:hypothetical protein
MTNRDPTKEKRLWTRVLAKAEYKMDCEAKHNISEPEEILNVFVCFDTMCSLFVLIW